MKPPILKQLGTLLLLCFAAGAIFTACEPEDDDFFDFRPVDFFINADTRNIDVGQTITYQDSSLTGVSREWTFEGGDPATSTEQMPTVRYFEPGVYTTSVITTLGDGSTQRRMFTVEVFPEIVADFSADATQVVAGNPVQFINQTQGVGVIPQTMPVMDSSILYKWVIEGFSDDTIIANNPVARYQEIGTYDVSLTVVRRATGFTSTIVKEDFIQVVDVPVLQPRSVRLERDGAAMLIIANEPFAALPGDAASGFSLSAGGTDVPVSSVSIAPYSSNTLVVDYDETALTAGDDLTLTYSGDNIFFASESILGGFDQTATYGGGNVDWLDFLYPGDNPNQTLFATQNGRTYTSDSEGVLYAWGCNANINVLNAVGGYRCPGVRPSLSVVFGGEGDASIADFRDVAFEVSFIGANGSTIVFNQPVTDLRFHNQFGGDVPTASLSADGLTLTVDERIARSGGPRITGIFEGPINEFGVNATHDNPEDINLYISASLK